MDCSTPHSSVFGILQARIPEGIAISSSRGPSWPRQTHISYIGRQILHLCANWKALIIFFIEQQQQKNIASHGF